MSYAFKEKKNQKNFLGYDKSKMFYLQLGIQPTIAFKYEEDFTGPSLALQTPSVHVCGSEFRMMHVSKEQHANKLTYDKIIEKVVNSMCIYF